MNKYQVYVDWVHKNEDWDDDNLIHVEDYIIEASEPDEAREKAADRFWKENPGKEYYVWEVTEQDLLED